MEITKKTPPFFLKIIIIIITQLKKKNPKIIGVVDNPTGCMTWGWYDNSW
jgi:hypothetical protein